MNCIIHRLIRVGSIFISFESDLPLDQIGMKLGQN